MILQEETLTYENTMEIEVSNKINGSLKNFSHAPMTVLLL